MSDRYLSPLRYPGGKARIAPYIASLIRSQRQRPTTYAEPYAGGAGAALRLLVDETVRSIIINDLSPGIAAFWRCVFYDTKALAQRIETADISIQQWRDARDWFEHPSRLSDIDLGFATFFLNRCNRSGILGARPIGGLEQDGKWKIDARFNRTELAERVRRLGHYRRRVTVSQLDGRDFLRQAESSSTKIFAYVDPPYIAQGDDLYLNSLSSLDHEQLARHLRSCKTPWMLTYDVSEKVTRNLYAGLRTAKFDISHTAQRQHVGSEVVVFSSTLDVDSIQLLRGANATWLSA